MIQDLADYAAGMGEQPVVRTDTTRSLRGWPDRRDAPVAVLRGPFGIGRSHAARQLAATLRARGWDVLELAGSAASRPTALAPFATVLPATPDPAPDVTGVALVLFALDRRAEAGPLAVVVDDAHHLDTTSIAVLDALRRSARVPLLLTVASDVALPLALAALLRAEGVVSHQLAALDEPATRGLAASVLGAPLADAAVATLWQRTHGVPAFVIGDLHGTRDAGRLIEGAGCVMVRGPFVPSERLRAAVAARIASLAPAERDALELLAAAAPLALSWLEQLVDPTVLDTLEARGLLAVAEEGQRIAAVIAQPLLAELVREGSPTARRRELARRLVAVATATPARRTDDGARLAMWQLQAGMPPHPVAALRAAEGQLSVGDLVVAERLARTAETQAPSHASAMLLGRAAAGSDRPEAAVASFARATERARDPVRRAEAITAQAQVRFFDLGEPEPAIDLVEAEIARCRDDDARDALEAARSLFASFAGDLDRAVVAGRRLGGRPDAAAAAVVSTLVVSSLAATLLGRFAEVPAQLATARAAAASVREQLPLARLQLDGTAVMAAAYEHGAATGALRRALAAQRAAIAEQDAVGIGFHGSVVTHLAALLGTVSVAEGVGHESLPWLEQVDPLGMRDNTRAHLAYVAGLAGQARRAQQRLGELGMGEPHPDIRVRLGTTLARIRLAALQGRLADAEVVARDEGARLADFSPVWGMFVAHEAVRVGATVADPARLISLVAGVEGPMAALIGDHVRAVVARDGAGLEVVAARAATLRLHLLAAEIAVAAARCHRRGRSVVGESRAIFLAQQHAAKASGASVSGLADHEWPLTDRETQVARLAVTGVTDRGIAAQLGLSPRTVSNHLGAVYRKLDLDGRAALTAVFGTVAPAEA